MLLLDVFLIMMFLRNLALKIKGDVCFNLLKNLLKFFVHQCFNSCKQKVIVIRETNSENIISSPLKKQMRTMAQ